MQRPVQYRPSRERDFVSKYQELKSKWEADTLFLSSIDDLVEDESFKKIVAMGDVVVDLILRDLSSSPGMIYLALEEITGDDPVPPRQKGRIKDTADAWLSWAENANIVSG